MGPVIPFIPLIAAAAGPMINNAVGGNTQESTTTTQLLVDGAGGNDGTTELWDTTLNRTESLELREGDLLLLTVVLNVTVAGLIVESARRRRESRGAHHRIDFPDRSGEWVRHVCLTAEEPA